MKRRGLLAAAVLLALAGAGLISARGGEALADEDWTEVRREDLVLGVEVSGTLASVASVRLGPPQISSLWDYKIAFMAPEGSTVREGQPVVAFDTSELEVRLQEALARRDTAQKELEKRETDLAMRRGDDELRLAEAEAKLRKAAPKLQVPEELAAANELRQVRQDVALEEREIAYRGSRLRLEGAKGGAELAALRKKRDLAAARVREAQSAIERMTVRAPRSGTVVHITERGEKKKVGDSVWRGDQVIEIPDLGRMKALGEADEADAGRIAAGQRVTLRLDAHPDVVYTGRVRSVRSAVRRSRVTPQKMVDLDIELDRTDPQRMRPGMRFVGTVEIERVPGAVVVPAEAVFSSGPEGPEGPEGPVVYRRAGRRAEEVRPRLGRGNGQVFEVVSGLAAGDRVSRRLPKGEASK